MAGRSARLSTRRAVFGLSVSLVLAGCASSVQSTPSTTGPSAPAAHASSPVASGLLPAGAAGADAHNLAANGALKAALLAAYAAAKGLPEADVTGPLPGTLYYGIASTTYWALAQFSLTPSAPPQAAADMQGGGNIGVFSRHGDQAWTVRFGAIPFPCPGELPADLLSVWGIRPAGVCSVLTANSPAKAQATPANVPNMPAGTYFGVVLDEQLQLNGHGAIQFEPENWQGTVGPASPRHVFYSLNIGPSTVTGYWTGPSRSTSHEVSGNFNLVFAHRIQSAMVPFMTQPMSGYQVTVSLPQGCSPGCSQVAKIVQINAVAPLPENPDYSLPLP